jgi:iron complex outermembrane receptor protein
LWAAVSRAMRTPSRFESGLGVDSPSEPVVPNPGLQPEMLTAYEIGWRGQLTSILSVDLTAYHNVYDRLIVWGLTPEPAPIFYAIKLDNAGRARSDGVEAAVEAHPTARWTLKLAASQMHLSGENMGVPVGSLGFDPGNSPRNQVSLRSWYDLTDALDLDVWYRRVDALRSGPVGAYDDLSVRVAWRPTPRWELSIRGVDLLSDHRVEMLETGLPEPAAVVQRRVQLAVTARY